MGAAYGAGSGGSAKRIGVIIGPDGTIKEFTEKADTKTYPTEALKKI